MLAELTARGHKRPDVEGVIWSNGGRQQLSAFPSGSSAHTDWVGWISFGTAIIAWVYLMSLVLQDDDRSVRRAVSMEMPRQRS